MRKAFLLVALAALTACTRSPAPSPTALVPAKGTIQANPQLITGEKNLPGMEGLDWSAAKSGIHTDDEGMLPRITIEGCVFSRRPSTKNWPIADPHLDRIHLEYTGPNADLQKCIQKVTAYFTDRLGPNPMLREDNSLRCRYWFGLKTEVMLGTRVEKHTYSYIFEDKERSFFISYDPAGTFGDWFRVEE